MKMHRVREFDPAAWPEVRGNKRVYIQCGWVRFTATADEAEEFAKQLTIAAQQLRERDDD